MTDLEKNALIMIRRQTAVTRAELARKLAVSRPTSSSAVASLLRKGLVAECGKGESTGGIAPILLEAAAGELFFAGIDFGYTDRMSGVIIDGAGSIVKRAERGFDPGDMASIADNAATLLAHLAPAGGIVGTAVALSAVIDSESRKVLKSINPLFCREDFSGYLSEKLRTPVFVANRSRAAAFSEAFGGAADRISDFALISLGRSVGAAFWCSGNLFGGSCSSAGEIRSLRVAGGERFEDAVSRLRDEPESSGGMIDVCADALSQIIEIMDIRTFLLSGRFADFSGGFASALESRLNEYSPVRVLQAEFGRYSAARGGALLMGENFIRNMK